MLFYFLFIINALSIAYIIKYLISDKVENFELTILICSTIIYFSYPTLYHGLKDRLENKEVKENIVQQNNVEKEIVKDIKETVKEK